MMNWTLWKKALEKSSQDLKTEKEKNESLAREIELLKEELDKEKEQREELEKQ